MKVLLGNGMLFALLLLSCGKQIIAQVPGKPEILSVNALTTPEGHGSARVMWRHQANALSFLVRYTDTRGRQHEKMADGQKDEVVVSFLQPCMGYTFSMVARNEHGTSVSSDEIVYEAPEITPPGQPTILNSTETLEGYMLSWKLQVIGTTQYFMITSIDEYNDTVVNRASFYEMTKLLTLDPRRTYNTYMTADNACGRSVPSQTVKMPKTEPPTKPARLMIEQGYNQIIVTIVPGEQKSPIFEYTVSYQKQDETEPITLLTRVPKVILNDGIEACMNYTISVVAINRGGQSDPAITYATAKSNEIPSRPVIHAVRETDGMPTVYWTVDSVHPLIQQKLKYEANGLGAFYDWIPGDDMQVPMRKAQRCKLYQVQVIAENKCGWSFWPPLFKHVVEPVDNPAIITGLTKKVEGKLVTIQWPAPTASQYILEFNVYLQSGDGRAWSYWASSEATGFVFPDLPVGAAYGVSLQARNPCGWSKPSASIGI